MIYEDRVCVRVQHHKNNVYTYPVVNIDTLPVALLSTEKIKQSVKHA